MTNNDEQSLRIINHYKPPLAKIVLSGPSYDMVSGYHIPTLCTNNPMAVAKKKINGGNDREED